MRLIALAALTAVLLGACETSPKLVPMEPAAFEAAVTDARSSWHPYASINAFTKMAETQTLTPVQRAKVLYERGAIRTEQSIELPAAIDDFQQAAAIPENGLASSDIEQRIEVAQAKLDAARSRLAGLQTLPEWFDDKVAIGEVSAAAERFRNSGLAPDPYDAGLLEAAGYLCRAPSGEGQRWEYGENTAHLSELKWCETGATS